MTLKRITKHPILDIPEKKEVAFTWNGNPLTGYDGEMISSALIANDINVFRSPSQGWQSPGYFLRNGQCSQCLVIADGHPVKSCMTPLHQGMVLASVEGLPELPAEDTSAPVTDIPILDIDVLIIGGGPAGLSAAVGTG